MSLMRRVLDAFLPPGPIWRPKKNGFLDNFTQGIATNLQIIHDFIAQIAFVRNPQKTPILSDLEAEFGISPSDGATIAQRQAVLTSRMFSRGNKGQYWVLQNAITLAGFTGVNVYPNDPAVNPASFLSASANLYAAQIGFGQGNAFAGYYTGAAPPTGAWGAFAAAVNSGTLIVNGKQFVNNPQIYGCGSGLVFCRTLANEQNIVVTNVCGGFSYSQALALNYGAPQDYWKWPFVVFIAGNATFDASDRILTLTQCTIPGSRMSEFLSLVLHFKPMHVWVALIYQNS